MQVTLWRISKTARDGFFDQMLGTPLVKEAVQYVTLQQMGREGADNQASYYFDVDMKDGRRIRITAEEYSRETEKRKDEFIEGAISNYPIGLRDQLRETLNTFATVIGR